MGKKRTIILSTHILQEVSAICDRVVIINRGKIAAMDTIENLSGVTSSSGRYLLRLAADEYKVKNALADMATIKYSEILGVKEKNTVDVIVESSVEEDIRIQLFQTFADRQIPILIFRPMELTLEEIFIKVTGSAEAEAEAEPPQDAPKNFTEEVKSKFAKKPEDEAGEEEE